MTTAVSFKEVILVMHNGVEYHLPSAMVIWAELRSEGDPDTLYHGMRHTRTTLKLELLIPPGATMRWTEEEPVNDQIGAAKLLPP